MAPITRPLRNKIKICTFIRYPTKIPLVVEKHKAEKSLKDIDKVKRKAKLGFSF